MAIYKGSSMRIQTSDDQGGTYKDIIHEISFEFGVSREAIALASKDDESLRVPGSNNVTLTGNAFGDKNTAKEDLKSMLEWQENKTKKHVQIATGANTGDLIITSTDVYLQEMNFSANINEGLEYTFTMMVNNVSYSVVS